MKEFTERRNPTYVSNGKAFTTSHYCHIPERAHAEEKPCADKKERDSQHIYYQGPEGYSHWGETFCVNVGRSVLHKTIVKGMNSEESKPVQVNYMEKIC